MDLDTVAKEFLHAYYQAFDQDRDKLAALYRDESNLTFEGTKFTGTQSIISKFKSLGFKTCQHNIKSYDVQPSPKGGFLIVVTGQILPEGESNPLLFNQVFYVHRIGDTYALSNDFFRLIGA